MTTYKTQNFEYIHNGFKSIDKNTYHFCLLANEQTIFQRLMERGDTLGGWAFQQTKKCITAFSTDRFKEHIITDELNTSEIISRILKRISQE